MGLAKTFGPWAIALLILSLPIWLTPDAVALQSDLGVEDVIRILGVLIFISLLLERALEVFVSTLRNPEALLKQVRIGELRRRRTVLESPTVSRADRAELDQLNDQLMAAQGDLTNYKSTTQRLALWMALSLGLFASAVGIRSLEPLIADGGNLIAIQDAAFRLTDVLLTGGLIGGGSEGIHRVTKVFGDFMDSTAKKARGET